MSLFKYIGLGILGLGGISFVAALSSIRVREFIGLSSPFTEEDRQWQFLYKIAQKLFNALKTKDKEQKSDVIKGLKDKFNGSLESEEDTWENFKSLCDEQKTKETQDENLGPYVSLCSLESTELEDVSGTRYSSRRYSSSGGDSFNKKYPNENPIDKFDSGHSSEEPEAKGFDTYLKRSSGSN